MFPFPAYASGIDWDPGPAALALCVSVLQARRQGLGSVDDEERAYDDAVKEGAEVIHLGVQRLRLVEARILEHALNYVQGLMASSPT